MQNAIIFPFTDYMPLPRVGWGGGGLMLPRNFNIAPEPSVLNHLSTFFFFITIIQLGVLSWEIQVAFIGETRGNRVIPFNHWCTLVVLVFL